MWLAPDLDARQKTPGDVGSHGRHSVGQTVGPDLGWAGRCILQGWWLADSNPIRVLGVRHCQDWFQLMAAV